ncbi:MAG TPA: hypothetical protein VJL58_12255 [Pyrinomonadaceae bacterium]|nr:hypothetical protein [Pyrinomonadaceae bacterium]
MNTLLACFEAQFESIHSRSVEVLSITDDEFLFRTPRDLPKTFAMFSIGEYVLRSAAAVEQTFGGITTKLWDDPFEWTLPEKLSTTHLILDYLDEVAETRRRGFTYFKSDADLSSVMPAPERLTSIFELLLNTVARAEHFQGRAFAVFQFFSGAKLPRL